MNKMRETDLVRACLDILAAKKIVAWRVNSGGVAGEYKGRKRFVRFNTAKGHADIAGVLAGGRALFIECKVGRNVVTVEQARFLYEVSMAGALALVIYTPDELMKHIEGIETGS